VSDETVLAFLEDKGYRRDQIGKLTRRYIRDVLQHERNEDGSLKVQVRKGSGKGTDKGDDTNPKDHWEVVGRALELRGYAPHQVRAKIKELKRQAEEAKKAEEAAVKEMRQEAEEMARKIRETMRRK
jgi:lysyl-tRNA synthetase class I